MQDKNVLKNFKDRLFLIKRLDEIATREKTPELATEPTKQKKPESKLQQKFTSEIIANEDDINDKTFWNYFKYQNLSFLRKDLIRAEEAKKE